MEFLLEETLQKLAHVHLVIVMLQWFHQQQVCTLADSGFFKNFLYQGGVMSTVSWVFEDLKFKILKYPRNCGLHATLILNLVKPLN